MRDYKSEVKVSENSLNSLVFFSVNDNFLYIILFFIINSILLHYGDDLMYILIYKLTNI
jgi:hypothetical protein